MSKARPMPPESVTKARAAGLRVSDAIADLSPAVASLVLVRVLAAIIVTHYPKPTRIGIAHIIGAHLEAEIGKTERIVAQDQIAPKPSEAAT